VGFNPRTEEVSQLAAERGVEREWKGDFSQNNTSKESRGHLLSPRIGHMVEVEEEEEEHFICYQYHER